MRVANLSSLATCFSLFQPRCSSEPVEIAETQCHARRARLTLYFTRSNDHESRGSTLDDTDPATQAESAGRALVRSNGAAESAAIDAELAIVIQAWQLLAPDSRSVIVGMSRKAAQRMALGSAAAGSMMMKPKGRTVHLEDGRRTVQRVTLYRYLRPPLILFGYVVDSLIPIVCNAHRM